MTAKINITTWISHFSINLIRVYLDLLYDGSGFHFIDEQVL